MSDRDTILAGLRKALGSGSQDESRRKAVEARLAEPPTGLIPERGQRPPAERVALFRDMLHAVDATTEEAASTDEVPARVADYLRGHNLPQAVVRGEDGRLEAMPWADQPQLETRTGRADGSELAGLSHAFGGVAETGTLVLQSGPDNPTTVNFLPEHHLVVVRAEDIAGDYEAVLTRLRTQLGAGAMPRIVNLITGPSRSADIQQTLLLGAHGPRRLHVIVVGDGAGQD